MKHKAKARVFISCGQQKGTSEIRLAELIAARIQDNGFEPYIATAQQSLRGLKENIFQKLSQSEYIIFIDLKRERLYTLSKGKYKDTGKYRGSLFSNQELALATFLEDIKCLAFQEKGVKSDDGILKFIQANCCGFTKRKDLSDLVDSMLSAKLKSGEWSNNWRNELVIERDKDEYEDAYTSPQRILAKRYYHLKINNIHRQKTAYECFAYVESIMNTSNGNKLPLDIVELKWKGVSSPRISIPPKRYRELDALHAVSCLPQQVSIAVNSNIVDYSGYYHTIKGPGNFDIAYIVFSNNFPPTQAICSLSIGQEFDDIKFYEKI